MIKEIQKISILQTKNFLYEIDNNHSININSLVIGNDECIYFIGLMTFIFKMIRKN